MSIIIYITRKRKFLIFLLKLKNKLKHFYIKYKMKINQFLVVLTIILITAFVLFCGVFSEF